MQLFDSHFHIIDHQYPLQKNHGFIPNEFLVEDYRQAIQHEHLAGGVVVSGSFQGYDHSYIKPALDKLGANYVAVAQLRTDTDEETIIKLNAIGVRGIRFNLKRSRQYTTKDIVNLAHKVYATAKWHAEFYIDSALVSSLYNTLATLPSICIDHLGLSLDGFKHINQLIEKGARIKASGFGRVNFEVAPILRKIYAINPNALMFGSDLPSTRARRKYSPQDLALISNAFTQDEAKNILYKNAFAFYRFC